MSHDLPLADLRVLMFVGDDYEDLELWYPKLRLAEAGAHGPEVAIPHDVDVPANAGEALPDIFGARKVLYDFIGRPILELAKRELIAPCVQPGDRAAKPIDVILIDHQERRLRLQP
jgi:protease I